MWFQFRQVDFNYLVEIFFWISVVFGIIGEVFFYVICKVGNFGMFCSMQVVAYSFIVIKG